MKVDYECDDGKTENIGLAEFLDRLITVTVSRLFKIHNLLLPRLI